MEDRELNWDDAIEKDGQEFRILTPGEYAFRVVKFERSRYTPKEGSKIPACNMAKLTLNVGNAEDDIGATIETNLFLVQSQEWKLCAFFRSIGSRKHGERVVMDWSKVVGKTGACKVKLRSWKGKDGSDRQSNEIESFIAKPEGQQEREDATTAELGW
jgi:hypothetical protein